MRDPKLSPPQLSVAPVRWLRGDVFGLDRFGASAPGTTVLEKFGFTPDGIASRARDLLTRIEETQS